MNSKHFHCNINIENNCISATNRGPDNPSKSWSAGTQLGAGCLLDRVLYQISKPKEGIVGILVDVDNLSLCSQGDLGALITYKTLKVGKPRKVCIPYQRE